MVDSRLHLETPLFLLIMRRDAAFAASPFGLCDRGRNNNGVSRATGLILITLSQPKRRQGLLVNSTRLPLRSAPEKKENLLQITEVAASTDLPEKAMDVQSKAVSSVFIHTMPTFATLKNSTRLAQ